MKSINFLSKSKGRVISLKMLAAVCLFGSAITLTHYLSLNNYINENQATNLNIKSLSENVVSGVILINQGETKNADKIFTNIDYLNKAVDSLYKKNDSLTGMIFGDNYFENNKESIDRIKSGTDQLVDNVSNLKEDIDLFRGYAENKANLKKDFTSANQRIIAIANNPGINETTKALLTRIYQKLNRLNIFSQGDLLISQSEILAAQTTWLKEYADDMKELNSFSNSVIGSKLSMPVVELVKDLNNIYIITGNINKISQINNKYGNVEILSKLMNNINNETSILTNKNIEVENSAKNWLYTSVGLMFLFLTLLIIEIVKGDSGNRKFSNKSSKSHQQLKVYLKSLDDDLGVLMKEKDKSISREIYHKVFSKPKITGDTTTFNIRNKIDKILNILFSIADKSLEKSDDILKINKSMLDKTEHIKDYLSNQKEEFLKLETDITKLIQSLGKIETGTGKAVNQVEHMRKRIEELDPLIQNVKLKMNSIRKNSQDTSKKIKRMSESSQNIGELTDSLRETSSKIEVLALDIAIDSVSLTTEHRKFSVISKEIQRLVETSRMDAKKIDDVITVIKEDSTSSLSSMETNIAEVVDCDSTIDFTGKLLKRIMDDIALIHQEIQEMDNITSGGNNKRDAAEMRNLLANVKKCMQECLFYADDMHLHTQTHIFEEINNLRNDTKRKINDGDFSEEN